MMAFQRMRRLLSRPPREIAGRVIAYASRRIVETRLQLRDCVYSTFPPNSAIPAEPLLQLIAPIPPDQLSAWRMKLLHYAAGICEHRFDLLGSGPVNVYLGMTPMGLEGYRYAPKKSGSVNGPNRSATRRLRCCISSNYHSIDWHIDFRSGYRWPVDAPYSKVAYGVLPGVDIKLPWELARMQHTPSLALAYSQLVLVGDEAGAARFAIEFQDQVLDFISANPPRFGVNWACTMDVSIRVVSWLVAYDLFQGFGAKFDTGFDQEFKRSIIAHGQHIVNNLEWFPHLCSNHYLSNVAGLFFIAAYLPESQESKAWLALASNELSKEIFGQFQADGSNFEGSTSYHRLSAEMALFSVALAHRIRHRLDGINLARDLAKLRHCGPGRLPEKRAVPSAYRLTDGAVLKHLAKMAQFTQAVTKPDGAVVQIGDNDSGRFLRLSPDSCREENDSWELQPSGHQALISGIIAACDGVNNAPASIDALVVHSLMGKPSVGQESRAADNPAWSSVAQALATFPDFGLYIYCRSKLWLSVRCGSVGQGGNGGHAHNDQLSIEICLAGVSFIADPGTYVYTPLPSSRNAFRSTVAHATLMASPGEQNGWLEGREGLFSMTRIAAVNVIEVLPNRFVGEHHGFDKKHTREIKVNDDSILVTDTCYAEHRLLIFPLAPNVQVTTISSQGCRFERDGVTVEFCIDSGDIEIIDAWFSPSYGRKINTKSIHVKTIPPICRWKICLLESLNG